MVAEGFLERITHELAPLTVAAASWAMSAAASYIEAGSTRVANGERSGTYARA